MLEVNLMSELWTILARAFLPPTAPAVAGAFCQFLADDLDELVQTLALPRDDIEALRASLAAFADNQALLIHYSGLFLAPPVKARLNLCHYLDGGANGASLDEMELAYAHHGIAPSADFHDLPDHLSMQLEFLAVLCGTEDTLPEAALFARRFLVPAVARLGHDIAENTDGDSPYLHLSKLALSALRPLADRAVVSGEAVSARPLKYRHDSEKGVWRHCKRCEKPFAREKELAVMAKALTENLLPSEHLAFCPDCRDASLGWQKRDCEPARH